jgi:hypothetical protein
MQNQRAVTASQMNMSMQAQSSIGVAQKGMTGGRDGLMLITGIGARNVQESDD